MQDLPIFYAKDILKDKALPETETQHCLRVLRLSVGDNIIVTDGQGKFYEASISETSKKTCKLQLNGEFLWSKTWQKHITLCVVPTKSIDRIEWLVEKAIEVGVDRIICVKSKHSERKHIKAERLEKIMLSAMKQSQKAILPELLVDVPYNKALELCKDRQILLAHCREASDSIQERKLIHEQYNKEEEAVALFIGPEGDFSVEEIIKAQDLGAKTISLGDNRLRTETAGFVALNTIHILNMLAE